MYQIEFHVELSNEIYYYAGDESNMLVDFIVLSVANLFKLRLKFEMLYICSISRFAQINEKSGM